MNTTAPVISLRKFHWSPSLSEDSNAFTAEVLADGKPLCFAKDDGNGAGRNLPRVSEEQAANLQALVEETGADKAIFLRYFKAESYADIAAQAYTEAVRMLERKRKGGK